MNMTDVLTEAKNIIEADAVSATVTITKDEHELFTFGAKLLAALKAEGIEEWQGFNRAVAAMGA